MLRFCGGDVALNYLHNELIYRLFHWLVEKLYAWAHTYKMCCRYSAAQNSLKDKWDWGSREVHQHWGDLIRTIYVCLHKWHQQMSEEILQHGLNTPKCKDQTLGMNHATVEWLGHMKRSLCHISKMFQTSFISASSVRWPRFDAPRSENVTHVNITADRLYTHLLVHANIIWNLPRASKGCLRVLIQSETFEEVLLRDWDAQRANTNSRVIDIKTFRERFCSCF